MSPNPPLNAARRLVMAESPKVFIAHSLRSRVRMLCIKRKKKEKRTPTLTKAKEKRAKEKRTPALIA
jgi:hypothetical protein